MRRPAWPRRSMPFYFSLSDQLKSYWFGCKRGPNEAADLSRLFGPQQIFWSGSAIFIFQTLMEVPRELLSSSQLQRQTD